MKPYQHFAKVFTRLLGCHTAIRLTFNGSMHVSVEDIGQFAEDNRLIAISRTGEQNCEVMCDPEMVFEIHTYVSPLPGRASFFSKRLHGDNAGGLP